MKRGIIIFLILLLDCPFVFSQFGQINFSVSPPLVELKVFPGRTSHFSLSLLNKNGQALDLTAKVMNLELSESGEPVPVKSDLSDTDCSLWITLPEKKIRLLPNEQKEIKLKVSIPSGVSGGQYAVILFEAVHENDSHNELRLVGQLGTILMMELYGRKVYDAEICEFSQTKSSEAFYFNVGVENTGNIHCKARGSILILNAENRIIDRIPLQVGTGTILPAGKRVFQAVWSNKRKMKSGTYEARVQLTIPGVHRILQKKIAINI